VSLTATNGTGTSAPATQAVAVSPEAGGGGGGEITVGASSQAVSTAATTSVTIGAPAGLASGDVVIAQFTVDGAPTVGSAPSGWSPVVSTLPINTTARVFVYYHVVADAGAEPASWTWQLSSSKKWNAVATAFRGVDPAAPFESAASTKVNNSVRRTVAVPGVTASAGAYLVGGVGVNSGSTAVTAPTGWTETMESSGAQVSELAYQPRPTAGDTGTASWTLSASQTAGAWLRALHPSAG
jgi:hypothetical protein